MKKRIVYYVFAAFLFFGTAFCFAEDQELFEIGTNAKTSTYVDVNSKNRKFTEDEIVGFCEQFVKDNPNSLFASNWYDTVELLETFDDNYIYGTAVMAAINLHYGFVKIDYSKWNDEDVSIVGWDTLYFLTFEDGYIFCVIILDADSVD